MDALALGLQAQAEGAAGPSVAAGNGTELPLAGSKVQARATWNQSHQLLKINELDAQYRAATCCSLPRRR